LSCRPCNPFAPVVSSIRTCRANRLRRINRVNRVVHPSRIVRADCVVQAMGVFALGVLLAQSVAYARAYARSVAQTGHPERVARLCLSYPRCAWLYNLLHQHTSHCQVFLMTTTSCTQQPQSVCPASKSGTTDVNYKLGILN
jgi:hypothetical protein